LSLSQAVELPGVPPENVVILLIDPQTLVVRGKLERLTMREAPRSESWGRSREDVKMVEESEPEEAKADAR
jgi:hypothetical protein